MKHVKLDEIELGPPPTPRDATPLRSATSSSKHTDAPPETTGGASVASGLFNMSNTILGAGMLGLPHAFSECGLGVGLVLLLVFACLSVLGLHLLSSAADIAGRPASFYGVAEKALPGSGMLIDAAIAIKCFGVATSYLIIVGDALPQAVQPFGASGVLLDRRLWTVGAAAAVAPLAFLRKIDALRHTSLVALVCIGFVTLLIVLFALRAGPAFDPCGGGADSELIGGGGSSGVAVGGMAAEAITADDGLTMTATSPCHGAVRLQTTAIATVHALPTFVFAFTCHQNIVSVTNEMARPSPRRALSVIGGAVGLALLQYLVIACAAYLTYGETVSGDVLQSYPASPVVSTARLAIATVVALSYPLQAHPCRSCIVSLVSAVQRRRRSRRREGGRRVDPNQPPPPPLKPQPESPQPTDGQSEAHGGGRGARGACGSCLADGDGGEGGGRALHLIVTAAFLLCSTLIAVSVDDLGTVLHVVGATGSTTVSYLLPGLCYFRLCVRPDAPLRWVALALFLLGLVIAVLSITLILVK